MNRIHFEHSRNKQNGQHACGYTTGCRQRGLVIWPDGSTSRIGERRLFQQLADGSPVRKAGETPRHDDETQQKRA